MIAVATPAPRPYSTSKRRAGCRPSVQISANSRARGAPNHVSCRPVGGDGASACALAALFAALALSACGGGSGSSAGTAAPGDGPGPSTVPPGSAEPSVDSPPNFVATDLVLSSETASGSRLSVSVSVANVGEGEAIVPDGWFIVSTSEDFSSGYVPYPVSLTSPDDGRVLAPGEQRAFDATNGSGNVEMRLQRYGTYYARLWVNPDRSANFTNPESAVVASHAAPESNYDDNFSPTAAFDRPQPENRPSSDCEPDALEENDSLDTAALIALDTIYTVNPCDDELDVFAVELTAGQVVELVMEDGASDLYRSVVAPDGTYLVRDEFSGNSIVRAASSARYHIIFRQVPFGVTGSKETSFSVNGLR